MTTPESPQENDETVFPDVSTEFIEEQKQASSKIQRINLVKPRQKFAPYTRAERQKRRKEVSRLHFELGMPAVKIADLMQVDRNTINADLKAIYSELAEPDGSIIDGYTKFEVRLECQRGRLMEYLYKEKDTPTKLMVERQITDIDSKLLSFVQRIEESQVAISARVSKSINEYAESQKLDHRVLSLQEIIRVSATSYNGVLNIFRKEKVIKWK